MKKFVCSIVSIIWVWIWFVCAQSISFDPQWDWVFWYNCVVPIDVYMDTNSYEISAIDLMMESSMDYVDFVPSDFVPYFFKPIIREDWLIHIVWFTVDPSERVNWKWKIWTLYFSPKQWAIDGVVRLYFLWEWETIDTNLGIAWWIDVLKEVWQAYVKFSRDLSSCTSNITENILADDDELSETSITWWFAGVTYNEALENTVKTIDKKYWKSFSFLDLRCRVLCIILLFILLIILVLLLKKQKNKWNKNVIR